MRSSIRTLKAISKEDIKNNKFFSSIDNKNLKRRKKYQSKLMIVLSNSIRNQYLNSIGNL